MISPARTALRWWRRAVRPLRLWWIQRRLTAKARAIDDNLRARPLTVVSMARVLRDRYAMPGERLKQYVVDERREEAWDTETCPLIEVRQHLDDEDEPCLAGRSWRDLDGNNDCSTCRLLARRAMNRPDIVAWRAAKAQRPPICADRDKLSDEIAPPLGDLRDNPILAFVRSRR